MEQTRKNTDTAFTISGRLLASCAVAYMALPTILFLLGWVRPLFSVPAAMAVAAASVLLCVKLPVPTLHFTRRQLAVYLCALLLSLLWLLAGGITGVALQHADFVVRNPSLRNTHPVRLAAGGSGRQALHLLPRLLAASGPDMQMLLLVGRLHRQLCPDRLD